MSFKVTIDQFDGPLDLMLHLIKEKQMDIFDLNLLELANQYIAYLHQMEEMHLDIDSEYLVELAALVEYKSKKLLPNDKPELDDHYEGEDDEDLVRRLIEYKRYKEVTSQFYEMMEERQKHFDKPQSQLAHEWISLEEHYANTTPNDLIKAMNKVLNRLAIAQPYAVSVQTQRISVEEKIEQLKSTLFADHKDVRAFSDILSQAKDSYDLVITFLALLHMAHEGFVQFVIREEDVYFSLGVNHEQ